MEIKKIDEDYFVAPQITLHDLDEAKRLGIQSIVCNRPDNEAEDQVSHREIETKAAELGIEFSYIPVIKAPAKEAELEMFAKIYPDLPKPVLAYCRSGMRSTTIWALTNLENYSSQDILERASNAGYDLSSISDQINNSHN